MSAHTLTRQGLPLAILGALAAIILIVLPTTGAVAHRTSARSLSTTRAATRLQKAEREFALLVADVHSSASVMKSSKTTKAHATRKPHWAYEDWLRRVHHFSGVGPTNWGSTGSTSGATEPPTTTSTPATTTTTPATTASTPATTASTPATTASTPTTTTSSPATTTVPTTVSSTSTTPAPATTTVPTTVSSTSTAPASTTPASSGGASVSVAAPIPPQPYTVPAGATVVSSSAGLEAALAAGDSVIELANGTYASSSYFDDADSSSLYAQNLGGAVLTAGLVVGGNFGSGGATVEGLAFNVTDASTTFQNGELTLWGASGNDTSVLDTTFAGNWDVGVGLLATNPNGLVAQRLSFTDFQDEGIRASDNDEVAYGSSTPVINSISDISVNGVANSTPGASNGTAESGIWVGEPVTNGVNRVSISNCAVSGIETVNNSWNTTFSNLTINMSGPEQSGGTAVYMEHFTLGDTFTNFDITGSRVGFNAEWNDGTAGNEAAQNDTIENGTIDASGWSGTSSEAGIYLDEGTNAITISNVTFDNQNWAAVGAYEATNITVANNNTYNLAPGAVEYSTNHI